MADQLLQTTVVGSYPQPDWLVNRQMLSKVVPRTHLDADGEGGGNHDDSASLDSHAAVTTARIGEFGSCGHQHVDDVACRSMWNGWTADDRGGGALPLPVVPRFQPVQ